MARAGKARADLADYADRLRLFSPNARLYLLHVSIVGIGLGVFRLLFNFYVLSLGFDEALLGRLITTSSLTSLVAALPAGYVSDRLGRRAALFAAGLAMVAAVAGMLAMPTAPNLYAMEALLGLSQALSAVTLGPFLMENSGTRERTYLFSFSSGLQMVASFAGNYVGGRLPSAVGDSLGVTATSPTAYTWAIAAVAALAAFGLLPLLGIRSGTRVSETEGEELSPFQYATREPRLLARLVGPILITSIGAGLLMPFINVFYRGTFKSTDQTIGSLFALGSLAMAVGLLIAPPLAERYGKIRVVVVSQALSIPFLIMLGFAPWFWLSAGAYLVRLSLMNMSTPVYQAFVMEHAEERARATVASLVSMSWNVGWAFSPSVSGWIQVRYGFGPIFFGVVTAYAIAIYLYWRFFGGAEAEDVAEAAAMAPIVGSADLEGP